MSFDKQPEQDTQISFDDYEIPEIVEPRKPFLQRYSTILILAAIFIIAAYFRFTDTDFDQGTSQHPDEIAIVSHTLQVRMPTSLQQLFDARSSPLNLRVADRYPWGTVPVYIARGAAWLADSVATILKPHFNDYYLNDYHGAELVGRTTAGIFDLITLLLTFLIARRLFSTRTALIATALVAFSVINIQIAHFYITEPFLVVFMMAALYFTVILMQKPSWWAAMGAGIFIGLSVASKVSSALIFVMIIAALVLRAAYRRQTRKLGADLGDPIGVKPADAKERGRTFGGHFVRGLRYFLIATVLGVIAFGLGEPYALWQFDFSQFQARPGEPQNIGQEVKNLMLSNPWSKAIVEEAATQGGGNDADIPYTRQYVGTVPVLYQFEQIVFWGVGVVPGVIILAGLILALWLGIKRRPAEILLLSYAVPYFATLLLAETKWLRYSLPLIPVFCILGASFLVRGAKWAAERWPRRKFDRGFNIRAAQRSFFPILTASAIIFAFLWSVAYMNVYSQDHTRVQAAKWLNDNAPAGSKISHEGWDAGLPNLIGMATGKDADIPFDLYDDHPADEELNYIHGQMNKVDYIAIASDRLYQSISRMPWRYPVQIAFYQNLYAGKLGFQLVHTEQVVPSLFGIEVNDQLADESFTVYDHPRVDIFKKVTTLTDDQMSTLFSSALDFPLSEYSTARHGKVADDKSLMYDQPLSDQPDVGNYAWNPLAQNDSGWFAALFWLVAVYLISIAAMPIVFTVFRRLPDRGYAFAKLAGLVIVTYGVWMLASGHVVPFTTWSVLLMLLALFMLAVILWRMGASAEIKLFLRQKRNLILFYEGLFLATFAFMLFIRILSPDVWHTAYGGEKTMEIGFLNSALRSPWMPPADPFFAGGYTNYYYQGQFIVACLVKLVGVDPSIAYNLSFPLLFGLCFTAAASIVYNLVAWSRKLRGSVQIVSRVGMAFGALAGILFLFIGNMHSLFEWLLITFPKTSGQLISFGASLGMGGPSWTNPYGGGFNFWDPSRIIPGTINEFPYWSFLYGDLHPHLIDMCFTLFATFLALNLVFAGRFSGRRFFTGTGWLSSARDWIASVASWLWGNGGAGLLAFGVTALSLGGLFVTNSWDYPTFTGLTAGAVLIAVLLSRRVPAVTPEAEGSTVSTSVAEDTRDAPIGARGGLILTVVAFASLGALVAVSLVAYLPFFLTFKAFFTKLMFITDGAPVANGGGAIMHRTTIWEFLVVWGIFVFISLAYLLVRLWSFPWRDALVDLFGIVPSSGQTSQQAALSPTAAAVYEDNTLRRARPSRSFLRPRVAQQMVPSFAGASGGDYGSVVAFMGSTPEDNAPQGAVVDGSLSAGGHAHDMPNGVEQHGPANGALNGGAPIEESSRLPEQQIPAPNGFATEPDGHGTESLHNWVAAAHTEALREYRVVDRTIEDQPGIIPLWLGFAILVATAALTVLQIATGQPLMALLVLLIGGITATLLSTTRSVGALGGGLLLVVALIVTIGLEMVYLADHQSGGDQYRSNTVFKFYIQAWELFAVGGAVAVYYIFFGVRDTIAKKRARNIELEQMAAMPDHPVPDMSTPASEPIAAQNGGGVTRPLNGGDTAPLSGTNTVAQSRNWLVWSTDAIEDVSSMSNGPDTVKFAAKRAEPLPLSVEPPLEPVITRRLRRAVLPGNGQRPSTVDDTPYVPSLSQPHVQTAPAVPEIEEYVIPAKPVDLLRFRWSVGTVIFALFFAFFLFVGFLYPLYGTPSKLKERIDPSAPLGTLSGLSYMQNSTFTSNVDDRTSINVQMKYDLEGINWLNQNVTGLHAIAELPLEYYRAGGMRVASNTGLPMVVGGLHQEEQRADEYSRLVGDRRSDMNTFYTTSDVQMALTLISKYNIDYIYLGQVEQAKAGEQGVKKFAQMADPKIGILTEVFRSDNPASIPGTIIYEVNHGDKDPKNLVGAPVAGSGVPGISITPLPTSTPIPPPTPPVDDPTLMGLIAAVSASPNSRDARQNLVDWYRDNNYPQEAAQELEILVQQNPSDIALRSELGDMYQSADQPDKALQAWEQARDIAPNNPDAHNKLGLAYFDRKRYDDSLAEYQAAVGANPHFVESWFHMGEVYERKGDAENAKKSYQSVIDNSTDDNSWKTAAQDKLNGLQ